MDTKDRLRQYLSFKNLSARELERICGISNGVLGRLSQSTSPRTLGRIELNSDLNLNWLFTGEGEMLRTDKALSSEDNEAISNDDDEETFQSSGSYREDDIPKRFITYLVPLSAMGGSLIGFDEGGVSRDDCERMVSPIADIDWVLPVCGDSMEPEYPNGSKVYVRKIDPRDFIAWGNVYVLDTTNGIIIKVVVESEREGCLRCISLNPSGRYTPFDVPMRTIRAMYRVMLCVSVK